MILQLHISNPPLFCHIAYIDILFPIIKIRVAKAVLIEEFFVKNTLRMNFFTVFFVRPQKK